MFLGRELECGPYVMPPEELAQTVMMVTRFMATSGPIFGDGHTLSFGGSGDSKDGTLVLGDSTRTGGAQPVFRLKLARQEKRSC